MKLHKLISLMATFALSLGGVASGYATSASDDAIVSKYCIDNAFRVSMGEDVIADFVGAGLVSSGYAGKTCHDIKVQSEIDQYSRDIMKDFVVPYNP